MSFLATKPAVKRHLVPVNPIQCETCGQSFTRLSNYKRHLSIHTNEKPFECDHCGRKFRCAWFLKEHKNKHLTSKLFACDICNGTFTHRTTLRHHLFVHSGERPLKCDVCGKRFVKNYNLKLHRRLHTGDLPFECGECKKRFNTKANLQSHSFVHNGIYPFKCDVCSQGFRKKNKLLQHYATHSNNSGDEKSLPRRTAKPRNQSLERPSAVGYSPDASSLNVERGLELDAEILRSNPPSEEGSKAADDLDESDKPTTDGRLEHQPHGQDSSRTIANVNLERSITASCDRGMSKTSTENEEGDSKHIWIRNMECAWHDYTCLGSFGESDCTNGCSRLPDPPSLDFKRRSPTQTKSALSVENRPGLSLTACGPTNTSEMSIYTSL